MSNFKICKLQQQIEVNLYKISCSLRMRSFKLSTKIVQNMSQFLRYALHSVWQLCHQIQVSVGMKGKKFWKDVHSGTIVQHSKPFYVLGHIAIWAA